jgi:hypothetical protein
VLPNIPDRPDRLKPGRADCVRTSGSPDTLPLGGPEPTGPVHAFALLHDALMDRDYPRATRARRDLRGFGYSVVPLNTPRRGGRP